MSHHFAPFRGCTASHILPYDRPNGPDENRSPKIYPRILSIDHEVPSSMSASVSFGGTTFTTRLIVSIGWLYYKVSGSLCNATYCSHAANFDLIVI